MKAVKTLFPILLVTLAAASLAGEIRWAKSIAIAQAESKRSGKLLMVDFYTDWCGWCKKLDKDTYTDAKVIDLSNRVVSLKTDAEKEGKDLAKKYGVNGYPTILFLDPQGSVVGKIGGYLPPAGFAEELVKVTENYAAYPKLVATLKANPANGEANARMAGILAARDSIARAETHLAAAEKAGYKGAYLAGAYNAVGDHYQLANEAKKAIAFFEKAVAIAPNDKVKSYSLISLAVCCQMAGDKAGVQKHAKALVALKGADPEYVQMAKQMLQGTP
ncbi:MAG: thioredoxin fold domain-containing protein [Fimbriimonadaceae bacterium]|nr:thioredoxin fold domain-containing protein [Fimbriimonadaceae bacterium]